MRKNPPARWTLPTVVSPADSVCFRVPVPNDVFHIAAFKGALWSLAKAYSWSNDDAHTAKDVAAVWLAIYDSLEVCNDVITFRQEDDCLLEISIDGGETWNVVFNARPCADIAIIEAIEGGIIGAGSESPVPWCVEYNFLNGDANWFSAVPFDQPGCLGYYSAGVGWIGDCQPGGTFQRISIGYGIDLTDATITHLEVDIDVPVGASSSSQYFKAFGTVIRDLGNFGPLSSGQQTIIVSGLSLTGDDVQWITFDSSEGSPVTIEKIRFRGTGIRPLEPVC